jgi:hypothetical protein
MRVFEELESLAESVGAEKGQIHLDFRKKEGYFTNEEAEIIKNGLVDLGLRCSHDSNCHSDTWVATFYREGEDYSNAVVRIAVWYTKARSKAEKCAELRRQLEELGCEDE